jgi:hypothetical protein
MQLGEYESERDLSFYGENGQFPNLSLIHFSVLKTIYKDISKEFDVNILNFKY